MKIFFKILTTFVILLLTYLPLICLASDNIKIVEQEFISLLSLEKQGDFTKYMYFNDNIDYDSLLKSNKYYYLFDQEKKIINKYASQIGSIIPRDINTIIEVGPGTQEALTQKSIPILKSLGGLKKYIAVDIENIYAKNASKTVCSYIKNIACESQGSDVLKKDIFLTTNEVRDHTLVLFLGSTQNSFLDHEIVQFFNNIKGKYVIFALDINDNTKSILKAYDDNTTRKFAVNALRFFKETLNIKDLDMSLVKGDAEFDEKSKTLYGTVYTEKTQMLKIGDTLIPMVQGVKYKIIRSRKFDQRKFEDLLNQNGFSIEKRFFNKNDKKFILYLAKT